jgi:hypothetical protein
MNAPREEAPPAAGPVDVSAELREELRLLREVRKREAARASVVRGELKTEDEDFLQVVALRNELRSLREEVERLKGWCLSTIEAKLEPVDKRTRFLAGQIEELGQAIAKQDKNIDRMVSLGVQIEEQLKEIREAIRRGL